MNKEERIKYLQDHQDEVWKYIKMSCEDESETAAQIRMVSNAVSGLEYQMGLTSAPLTYQERKYKNFMDCDNQGYSNCKQAVAGIDITDYLEEIRHDWLCEHGLIMLIKENTIIKVTKIDGNYGSVDLNLENLREPIQQAKELDAGLYMVHNHPILFEAKPSIGDLKWFRMIYDEAKRNNVDFLDTGVVTVDDYYSLRQMTGELYNCLLEVEGIDISDMTQDRHVYFTRKTRQCILYIKNNKVIDEIFRDGIHEIGNYSDEQIVHDLEKAKELDAKYYDLRFIPRKYDITLNDGHQDVTDRIAKNAEKLGVKLADIGVISIGDYYSYKQQGKLI